MKYRIRKTKEIVDVVDYSACTHTRFPESDYVCYIDDGGNEIVGRGLNLIWDFEPINEESANDFDLQSFSTSKDSIKERLIKLATFTKNMIDSELSSYLEEVDNVK